MKLLTIIIATLFILASCKKTIICEEPTRDNVCSSIVGSLYDETNTGCGWVIHLKGNEKIIPNNLSDFFPSPTNGEMFTLTYNINNNQTPPCTGYNYADLTCIGDMEYTNNSKP